MRGMKCNAALFITSRVPVEGKSSVCVICMKYRILFYYHQPVSNSIIVYGKHLMRARTHARTHARTNERAHAHACACTRADACTPPHTHTHCRRCIGIRCQPTVTGRSAGNNSGSLAFEINSGTGGQASLRIWKFFAYKKIARPN